MTQDILTPTESAKRGRKPLPAAEVVDDNTNLDVARNGLAAATELTLISENIAATYGDGLAYERERVVNETQFFMAQSAEAMLEVGKRLIQIKENEPHGDFTTIVTDKLGMGERTARAMMSAAAKFMTPLLEGKRKTFSVLGRAKLFELMTEDEDDLAQLADGGTLAGLKIDEIDAMSVRELRRALRDNEQIMQAKDKILADRSAKIDRLEERLHKPYQPGKESAARTKQEKIFLSALAEASTELNKHMTTVTEVMTDAANQGVTESCLAAAHNDLKWLAQRLAELMNTHGIELDLEELVEPSWVKEAKARAAAKKGGSV